MNLKHYKKLFSKMLSQTKVGITREARNEIDIGTLGKWFTIISLDRNGVVTLEQSSISKLRINTHFTNVI